jgi:hypothetical protein
LKSRHRGTNHTKSALAAPARTAGFGTAETVVLAAIIARSRRTSNLRPAEACVSDARPAP